MRGTLIFDVETHERDLLYSMPPEEFVRLIGYKWRGTNKVHITTDLQELREVILDARWIIGHNIHSFDLRAVFGIDSNIPMDLADQGRVFDSWVHASLVHPAPYQYVNREGKNALAAKPEQMKKWFSLDEQAYQLGVEGKTHDLKELALEFGDEELPRKLRINDGFGKIPVDDERFIEYLKGDVLASEGVSQALLKLGPLDNYALREQRVASRLAAIESNGWRIDTVRAQDRVNQLAVDREKVMLFLQETYDFPTEGKSPWATTEGKAAIMEALKDQGITEKTRPDWPKTPAGNLQLGGEVLMNLTEGTAAEALGKALAEVKGQRSLAQLALDSTYPDGKCHPEISALQRSGRTSTTKPGITIWTARGEGAVEKAYFLPDTDDEVLLEFDYSNADARMVAALSGDVKFAERFQEGADGHKINAIIAWGEDTYNSNPKYYRNLAKPGGHGWGYRIGSKKLAATWKLPVTEAKKFLDKMNNEFRGVVQWQDACVREAVKNHYVLSEWGRKLWVQEGREFTQAPALRGQNGTREIVMDAILALPYHWVRRIKAIIHDALVFSVPRKMHKQCQEYIVSVMETSFKPRNGGQLIHFPVSSGPPGANWWEAGHEL